MRQIDRQILELVRGSIQLWNDGAIERLAEQFREDGTLSSPFVSDGASSTWLQGRPEIVDHLKTVRTRYSGFKVINVSTDTMLYAVLLSDGRDYLTLIVEPDPSDLLVRRMIICQSVHNEFRVGADERK